jgi:cell division transport system permease protein
MISRTDLPLDHDAHARFLPWLIAFMVYLAVLAVTGILVLNSTVTRWDQGISGTLTVQAMPADGASDVDPKVLQDALAVLSSTPGVLNVALLDKEETLALVEPWLGEMAGEADLPLPRLIDVAIDADAGIDIDALGRRLAIAAPGVSVDDHRVWLDRLVRLLQTLQWIALSVVMIIFLVTIGTVVFTTRTGLAIHGEAIHVLHLIGAYDSYVARQFAGRALWLGLKGGVIGLAFAIPTLMAIGYFAERMQMGTVSGSGLGLYHYITIGALPIVVALIAMLTARTTVLRTLARMP